MVTRIFKFIFPALFLLVPRSAPAQILYTLSPSTESVDSSALTWTTGVNIGFDSNATDSTPKFAEQGGGDAGTVTLNDVAAGVPTSNFPGLGEVDPTILAETSGSGFSTITDPPTSLPSAFAEPVTFAYDDFPSAYQKSLSSIFLVTDASLALDDRFGFENQGLSAQQTDFQVSAFHHENLSSPASRSTTGIRADLDYALTEKLIVGAELFYSESDLSLSDFDASGFGLDATYQQSLGSFDWEIGLGAGTTWGDLDRNYVSGIPTAKSKQDVQVFTAHTALRNSEWSLFGLSASWEIGLKQRFVRLNSSTEAGFIGSEISYSGESLHTTLVNLELGLQFASNLGLELTLNPVLFHQGGDLEAYYHNINAYTSTPDFTGYDVHTARASLIFTPSESSTISADIVAGSENTWSTNLAYRLRF